MLGTETVAAMRTKNVSAIFCGLSANNLEEDFRRVGAHFLQKPFPSNKSEVESTLRRLIQESSTGIGP